MGFCPFEMSLICSHIPEKLLLHHKLYSVTVIKSLIIPKLICLYFCHRSTCSKGNCPRILFLKFLWKGTDKVTRLSSINDYENGRLKMIDLKSMVISLRLAWLKRIFGE